MFVGFFYTGRNGIVPSGDPQSPMNPLRQAQDGHAAGEHKIFHKRQLL
jgi:hypothetical protein